MKNIRQFRNKILILLTLFFSGNSVVFSYEKQFQHTISSSTWLTSQAEIEYWLDGTRVGFIHYFKIPLFGYILYNFYVYPLYRGKGYGKELLLYACDLLKKQDAKKIFIQPGPFELKQEVITDYQECLNKLVSLYQWCGFHVVSPIVSMSARLLYTIIGINEDACYLMVMAL